MMVDASATVYPEYTGNPDIGLEGFYPETYIGGGRALYAGASKMLSALPATENSARFAVGFRNFIKRIFRGPFAASNYRIKSYDSVIKRYGSNRAVIDAASRTNPGVNKALIPLAPLGVAGELGCTQVGGC